MTTPGDPDYDSFAAFDAPAQGPSFRSSHGVENALTRRVRRDLVVSPWHVGTVYVAASAAGYLCSLALCAQNSVGILPFSHAVAALMHIIPWPWCPLVCGALFSFVPTVLVGFFFTRFQRRYLLRRLWWLIALLPLVASALLIVTGDKDPAGWIRGAIAGDFSPSLWMILWTAGALVTPWILEGAFAALFLRRRGSRTFGRKAT